MNVWDELEGQAVYGKPIDWRLLTLTVQLAVARGRNLETLLEKTRMLVGTFDPLPPSEEVEPTPFFKTLDEIDALIKEGERPPAYFVDSPTLCTGAAHYIDRFSSRCQCGERSAHLDPKGEDGPSAT
jgi:hypothetical protein